VVLRELVFLKNQEEMALTRFFVKTAHQEKKVADVLSKSKNVLFK